MSLRLKIFIIGSFILGLIVCAVFLFIPKQEQGLIIDAPLLQSSGK